MNDYRKPDPVEAIIAIVGIAMLVALTWVIAQGHGEKVAAARCLDIVQGVEQ